MNRVFVSVTLPWECQEQSRELHITGDVSELLKDKILRLATQETVFSEFSRTNDSDLFEFELDDKVDVILKLLEVDTRLREMYKKLVPSRTSEEYFWKSYFYHVESVRNATLQQFEGQNVEKLTHILLRKQADDFDRMVEHNKHSDKQVTMKELYLFNLKFSYLLTRMGELESRLRTLEETVNPTMFTIEDN